MGVRIPEDAAIDTKERKRSLWGRFSRHFIKARSIRFCQYGLKKKMILVELVVKFKRCCTLHLLGCGSID